RHPGSPRLQRRRHLLAVTDRVVRAERDHSPVRYEELDAALHHVLHVEGPRIHEVARVDHEDVASDIARRVLAERDPRGAGGAAIGPGVAVTAPDVKGGMNVLRGSVRADRRGGAPESLEDLQQIVANARQRAVLEIVEVEIDVEDPSYRRSRSAIGEG